MSLNRETTSRITSLLRTTTTTSLRPGAPTSSPYFARPSSLHNQQQRHESTARRHRKLLNIPPAPAYPHAPTGSSGRSHVPSPDLGRRPAGDHVIFDPPSSAPNVYHTPAKFLPASDIRRQLFAQPLPASVQGNSPSSPSSQQQQQRSAALPPALREPYEKKYHVTPAQMEEMTALRRSDELTWTRARLAEKFACSKLFVGMVVQASEKRVAKLRRIEEGRRRSWGEKKRTARDERGRRREGWGRDD